MKKGLFDITTEVRGILLSDKAVRTYIGNKVFPVFAPEGTQGDLIIYFRDKYEIDRTQMGIAQQQCNIYLGIVSDSYDRSQVIAESVFHALEGDFRNPDMSVHLIDSTEDSVDGKYLQLLLFNIKER